MGVQMLLHSFAQVRSTHSSLTWFKWVGKHHMTFILYIRSLKGECWGYTTIAHIPILVISLFSFFTRTLLHNMSVSLIQCMSIIGVSSSYQKLRLYSSCEYSYNQVPTFWQINTLWFVSLDTEGLWLRSSSGSCLNYLIHESWFLFDENWLSHCCCRKGDHLLTKCHRMSHMAESGWDAKFNLWQWWARYLTNRAFSHFLHFIALIPMWMNEHTSTSHATCIIQMCPNHSNMCWSFLIEIVLDQPLCDVITSEHLFTT